MWGDIVALLSGAVVLLYALTVDRSVSRRQHHMIFISGGMGALYPLTIGGAAPAGSWVTAVAISMVVCGAFVDLVRNEMVFKRQRADPSLDPNRAFNSNIEGRSLLQRFDRTGDVQALNKGVELLRQAVRASSGEPQRTEYAANLVMALRGRYQRLGGDGDLDDAIEVGRDAARTEPVRDPRRGGLLSQLSSALRARHDRSGDLADLDEALNAGREAVSVSRRHPGDRVLCLGELSAVLLSRYARTEDLADLDEAVDTLEQVLLATRSADRPFVRVAHLTALCRALVQRYERTGQAADLDRAVEVGRQGADQVSAGYRLYEPSQNNFALALRVRYQCLRNQGDLDEAIGRAKRAVATVPDDDPGRASHLLNLALAVHERYLATQDRRHLVKALALARKATFNAVAELPTRVAAGLAWGDIAASAAEYREAVEAFETAIRLLPHIASRELRRADQEYRLGQSTGVAVTAAACAVAQERPEKAVMLLEQGRGVLLSQALDVRTSLAPLRRRHPELADEFEQVRRELDAMSDPVADLDDEDGMGREQIRKARRAMAARWDTVLERIRAKKGFSDFARGPSLDELVGQTSQGPLVFLNVSKYRSDAIILEPGGMRTVPLPDATPKSVHEQVLKLADAVRPEHLIDRQRQQGFAEVLAWLWDAIVEPVLDALDVHQPQPGQDWPRLWWVPTGSLALLPIHAAGRHNTGGATLLDRAVSSYTPTVRALARARARMRGHRTPRPLVVSMSHTPGAAPLANAHAEAAMVRDLFPATKILADDEALVECVLEELPRSTLAHFACHAVTDLDAPSQGRLLLHDHEQRPFTVVDVSRLDLRNAEVAYLSSCHTAQPGYRLSDEAIHLASSFQLAGFSQVIATLWPLLDAVALEFATEVYRQLSGSVEASVAVHHATRAARDMYPNLPALWAGHIHVGP